MDRRKSPDESRVEQTYIVRSQHINGYGRLFGGYLMQWIDELAGIVARKHSECQATTACVDSLDFKAPAFQNDIVVLVGRLTYVGRSSMEIRVETYVENPQGSRNMINCAYVVMIAIDQNGNAIEVPRLELHSEAEKAEWQRGYERYQRRKARRRKDSASN